MVSVAISLYAVFGGILKNFPSFAQQPINDAGAQVRILNRFCSTFKTIT
jgi:hypothetical protein